MSEFSYMDGIIDGQTPDSMGRSPIQQAYKVKVQKTGNASDKVKFTDIFTGFKPTVNGIVAMFFIGYALWLVVIYMIRHNEPLANQVLGTPTAGAPTSHVDRIIVGGAKYALPINSTGTQGFFTPDKKHHNIPASLQHPNTALPAMGNPADFTKQSEMALSAGQPAAGAPPADGSAAYGHSRVVHQGRERYIIHHPEPLPGETPQTHPAARYAPPAVAPHTHFGAPASNSGFAHHQLGSNAYGAPAAGGSRYNMPVQTQDGLKLRTVVNR